MGIVSDARGRGKGFVTTGQEGVPAGPWRCRLRLPRAHVSMNRNRLSGPMARSAATSRSAVAAARSLTRATHAARSCASATICPRSSPRRMTWCSVPGRRFRSKGGTEGSGRSAEGHRAAPVRASSVSASCVEGPERLRKSPLSQQRPAIRNTYRRRPAAPGFLNNGLTRRR
jgi:hypothetical protein